MSEHPPLTDVAIESMRTRAAHGKLTCREMLFVFQQIDWLKRKWKHTENNLTMLREWVEAAKPKEFAE